MVSNEGDGFISWIFKGGRIVPVDFQELNTGLVKKASVQPLVRRKEIWQHRRG